MTVKSFFDAYEGLWIESSSIDNVGTRDQCVDVFRVYNKKVVGGNDMGGNAVDYWTNYPTDFYDKIPNTPTGVPQLGDVMVWGTNYGTYGHIAVCTDIADTKGFTSFDQNDPLKSKCHYQPHTYTGLLGWLRPKSLPQEEVPVDPMKVLVTLGEGIGTLEVQTIRSMILDLRRDIKNEQEKLNGFVQKWITEWNLPTGSSLVDVEVEMAKLMMLEDTLQEYRNSIEACVGIFPSDQALLESHKAVRTQIEMLTKEVGDLQIRLSEAKVPVGYTYVKSWDIYSLRFKLYRKKVIT